MLKKTRSGTDKVKVTFVLPPQPHAGHVHVVGDFNEWQADTPMKRDKEGRWRATVELEPGREYQFRYLVDGQHWVNDDAADRYVPNAFGADNSVLTTPAGASAASAKAGTGTGGKRSSASGTRSKGNGSAGPKKSGGGTSRGGSSGTTSRGTGE